MQSPTSQVDKIKTPTEQNAADVIDIIDDIIGPSRRETLRIVEPSSPRSEDPRRAGFDFAMGRSKSDVWTDAGTTPLASPTWGYPGRPVKWPRHRDAWSKALEFAADMALYKLGLRSRPKQDDYSDDSDQWDHDYNEYDSEDSDDVLD